MSSPIDDLIVRVKAAAEDASAGSVSRAADREKLERLASEFESMLLNQVLQDMRKAGRWAEDEEDKDGYGVQSLFETLDAELSKQLASAQGFGLTRQLMDAFDRIQPPKVGATAKELAGAAGTGSEPPVAGITGGRDVTSAYGWRRDPLTGEAKFHRGVDLRAAYGEDVATAAGGKVVFSGTQGGYGTTVVVEHANGTRTRFAHLSLSLVETGDAVAPGQLVGRAGSSGRATGPHVHLETLDKQGRPMDPMGWSGDAR